MSGADIERTKKYTVPKNSDRPGRVSTWWLEDCCFFGAFDNFYVKKVPGLQLFIEKVWRWISFWEQSSLGIKRVNWDAPPFPILEKWKKKRSQMFYNISVSLTPPKMSTKTRGNPGILQSSKVFFCFFSHLQGLRVVHPQKGQSLGNPQKYGAIKTINNAYLMWSWSCFFFKDFG